MRIQLIEAARPILDALILERLIIEEAASRKISVSDKEVQNYIQEVASRNNLSPEAFEKALEQEHKNLARYKEEVKVEILKSRLTSTSVQGGVGVSDDEIESYIKEHSSLAGNGTKVKLRRIFVSNSGKSQQEAKSKIAKARTELSDGVDFAKVAGNCPVTAATFLGGHTGASVDVQWLKTGIYFFKVTAHDANNCSSSSPASCPFPAAARTWRSPGFSPGHSG